MYGRMDMDVWMNGCMYAWMYEWMYGCMYRWMDVWVDV